MHSSTKIEKIPQSQLFFIEKRVNFYALFHNIEYGNSYGFLEIGAKIAI